MTVSAAPAEGGAWAPLREPVFRALWLAILGSNIGTWINDVAASWVMAEQTGSPLMVAAVQSATTLRWCYWHWSPARWPTSSTVVATCC